MEDTQGNHVELVEAYIASNHALVKHDDGRIQVVKLSDVHPDRVK
jgi:hypothetical protein